MIDTLRRICELQPLYSSENTEEMQERGRLIRQVLVDEIKVLKESLARALGPYGADLLIEGSDGIGRKTELAWTRFCSESMSPRPTDGFYVVLHFSTDGSGVNIAVGCSSSRFHNGYSIVLPLEELDKRCEWARSVVSEELGGLEPFTDENSFGARAKLPKSFERACALVKKIKYDDIDNSVFEAADTGLVVIDGKLIEKPVLRDMYRIVAIADRMGR